MPENSQSTPEEQSLALSPDLELTPERALLAAVVRDAATGGAAGEVPAEPSTVPYDPNKGPVRKAKRSASITIHLRGELYELATREAKRTRAVLSGVVSRNALDNLQRLYSGLTDETHDSPVIKALQQETERANKRADATERKLLMVMQMLGEVLVAQEAMLMAHLMASDPPDEQTVRTRAPKVHDRYKRLVMNMARSLQEGTPQLSLDIEEALSRLDDQAEASADAAAGKATKKTPETR